MGNVWDVCPDPYAGLQVSTYSTYDLGHGLNTQTHTHTQTALDWLCYKLSQLG